MNSLVGETQVCGAVLVRLMQTKLKSIIVRSRDAVKSMKTDQVPYINYTCIYLYIHQQAPSFQELHCTV